MRSAGIHREKFSSGTTGGVSETDRADCSIRFRKMHHPLPGTDIQPCLIPASTVSGQISENRKKHRHLQCMENTEKPNFIIITTCTGQKLFITVSKPVILTNGCSSFPAQGIPAAALTVFQSGQETWLFRGRRFRSRSHTASMRVFLVFRTGEAM